MPALLRAYVITRRAAKVGFDWKKIDDVYDKMYEEIAELKEAEKTGRTDRIRDEVGDLLFTIVNIARFLSIDPEDALRSTSDKFIRRFGYIESNTDIRDADAETMDRLWNDSKSMEDKGE
jgi:tetrapyrrole methylase family protein/MazG family protein